MVDYIQKDGDYTQKDEGMATRYHSGDAADSPPSLPIDDDDFEYDAEEEKKVLRKVDMRLIPAVWLMYLLSYLDRSNIGNAYTAGMGRDLNMTSQNYSVVLLVFFVSYIIFEVPSNIILTRTRPSIYLPSLMFAWGGLSMCFAAVKTWQAAAGLRFLLGMLEATFAPGVLFLLSSWYKKHELARRYSLYYTAVALSGMFGGLIAGGLLQTLDGTHGIPGWAWLFIVEGAATCGVSIIAYLMLPDFPSTTRWLTPRERKILSVRLARDSVGGSQEGEGVTHGQAAAMAFKDWRTWAFSLLYCASTGAQTIQYFLPVLVKGMGYTGFHVQYMTAPIYAVALVAILVFCWSSDYFQERSKHLAAAAGLATVMFALLVGVLDNTARYVFLCFAVAGVYAACPLISIWVSNAIPHPSEKRAIAQAFVNALGNSASLWGSFLFHAGAKDYNRTGFSVNLALMVLVVVGAIVVQIFLKRNPYPEMQTPAARQAAAATKVDA